MQGTRDRGARRTQRRADGGVRRREPPRSAGDAERARLHELVERERNKPKPPPPKPKLLTITEVDGKENVVRVDPWEGGWLTVETNDAKRDEPWIIQPVVRRLGLMGIRSITVEDVNDE